MHELSIAQALVEQLEAVAAKEGAARVTRAVVTIGALAGVEPEALLAAFPLVAEGTVADAAALVIERDAGRDLLLRSVELEVKEKEAPDV